MTQTDARTPSVKAAPALGLVVAALGVVYVVWGSTYLGIRIVVEEAPSAILTPEVRLRMGAAAVAYYGSSSY